MPGSPVKPGMLLIAEPNLRGTFRHAVILLCEVNARGAHGVIINAPIEREETPVEMLESAPNLQLHYRRGGPVCGGRLGVVSYVLLHNHPTDLSGLPSATLIRDIATTASPNEDEEGAAATAPPPAAMLRVSHDRSNSPGSWSLQEVTSLLGTLNDEAATASAASAATPPMAACVIKGYARWGRGQLEDEIARGSWEICDGAIEDVLHSSGEAQWDELRRSGRLLEQTPQAEDEEDDEEDEEDGA